MTEPVYLISEKELDQLEQLGTIEYGDTEARDIGGVIRARGPVAQQAPVADICMDCNGEPATCKNDPSKCQHDPVDVAALIAQEREKWERELKLNTLEELDTTIWMLYEFCEWFCGHDCEETPCKVTVGRLHERLEGIQKQMKEHPEYLEKWNIKRAEQKAMREAKR